MKQLHQKNRTIQQKVFRLESRLAKLDKQWGVTVDDNLHGDLKKIMNDNSHFVAESYPENSFLGFVKCLFTIPGVTIHEEHSSLMCDQFYLP